MLNVIRNLFRKQPKPAPERVAPAPYVGPETFTCKDGGKVPYLDGIPDYHLSWAKLLLGDLLLDEGAGYFHNVGHRSLVLRTQFTAEDIAGFLRDEKGLKATAHVNDTGYGNRYSWVEIETDWSKPWHEFNLLVNRFNIEVREPLPHS